jgi:hypothetical protein
MLNDTELMERNRGDGPIRTEEFNVPKKTADGIWTRLQSEIENASRSDQPPSQVDFEMLALLCRAMSNILILTRDQA